ncbi:ErfK/YbiS/YcfS/YnhG family protein [Bradyrhizobium sp. CCBAU 51745]|nr:ErfK/YbiS/YcfS/YnhG family protein [Bradyrhizobium sp. CCBAU 51745]
MSVTVDGAQFATWPVSTARRGYRTPVGTYTPYSLERMHYSKLYDFTPMPYSIFFHAGYAIHGTYEVRSLGRPVSHGCIRLSPNNARSLFELIQAQGRLNTTIEIIR